MKCTCRIVGYGDQAEIERCVFCKRNEQIAEKAREVIRYYDGVKWLKLPNGSMEGKFWQFVHALMEEKNDG